MPHLGQGLDVALSVPADKAAAASAALSAAVSQLSPATCALFPLPPTVLQDLQTAADPAKLAAARKLLPPTLPGSEAGICLPPRASLPKLVQAEANALAAADATTLGAFEALQHGQSARLGRAELGSCAASGRA